MLYSLLKIPARFAFMIYCRDIKIHGRNSLTTDGPLLICSNHPNSLLDAVILSTLFNQPIHSLARGDVFKNRLFASFLRAIHMMPVYRVSEGVENMEQNYETFDECKKIFKKGGIVLIFSEGRCINEWHLRPLMKGTARLAISSWQEGINLRILPVGINYHSFHSFGKNIQLNIGEQFSTEAIGQDEGFGKSIGSFNNKLTSELKKLVVEINSDNIPAIKDTFYKQQPIFKKIFLFLPAIAGYLLHWPLYIPLRNFAWKRSRHNDHYDSFMVALLFITYPVYLVLIFFILYVVTGSLWSMAIFLAAPICAWSYIQLKKQF